MPNAPATGRALLALTLALAACATDADTQADDGFAKDGPVRYHDHVAPLLRTYCTSCHQPGGGAPMRLDTLDDARKWGPAAKAAVQARTMPPFLYHGDGSCGDWKDNQWLTDAEIKTVADWVDGDMPAGDAAKNPGAPIALTKLQGAIEREMPVDYQPTNDKGLAGSFDDYRCFPIPLGLKEDAFVTAVDVEPGNPEVVHHVLLFAVNPNMIPMNTFGGKYFSNQQVMDHLAATHGDRPGWPCYAAAGDGVLPGPMLVAWAPGTGTSRYPEGTGLKVTKDDMIVMQVHYNAKPGAKTDRTKIRLETKKTVEREAWFVLHDPFLMEGVFGNTKHSVEPGLPAASFSWTATRQILSHSLPESAGTQLELHAVLPHMHRRGLTLDFTIQQGDAEASCGGKMHHWDFDWQRLYTYKTPIPFDGTTKVKATCRWDTMGDTAPVPAGFGTEEEMCLLGMYLSKAAK